MRGASPGFTPRGLFHNPRGFTLVEVVVAAAILLILIIGLAGMFARGVTGFKQAQLVTMAQNLAEFQVEDIKNLAPSVLNQLVNHSYADVNYPYESVADWPCNETHVEPFDDRYCWAYDSGKLQTDFMVDGVTQIGSSSFTAGQPASAPLPVIPTDAQVLLGSNIVIEVYADDPDPDVGLRYWYDYDTPGWYYLWTDGGGQVQRTYVTLADPANTLVYYRVILQKEAYPLFSRQIRIAQYDADAPDGFEPFDSTETDYRVFLGDARTKFEYEITVWYKQNGADRVLFRSGGTIAVPFAMVGADRSAI
ncbi:MAG: prepilin-type N-terminal cleavage/methylation domain-containing protein [Caldisericia bacterium]